MNIDGHVLVYSFLLLFSLFSRLSLRERELCHTIKIFVVKGMSIWLYRKMLKRKRLVFLSRSFFQNDGKDQAMTMV